MFSYNLTCSVTLFRTRNLNTTNPEVWFHFYFSASVVLLSSFCNTSCLMDIFIASVPQNIPLYSRILLFSLYDWSKTDMGSPSTNTRFRKHRQRNFQYAWVISSFSVSVLLISRFAFQILLVVGAIINIRKQGKVSSKCEHQPLVTGYIFELCLVLSRVIYWSVMTVQQKGSLTHFTKLHRWMTILQNYFSFIRAKTNWLSEILPDSLRKLQSTFLSVELILWCQSLRQIKRSTNMLILMGKLRACDSSRNGMMCIVP